jgi:hypothetical protein
MGTINWESRGIVWLTEDVSERAGPNGTDTRVLGKAQIPQVTNLSAFVQEYGEGAVLGSLDGTSIRVMAQDVNRRGIVKRLSAEEIRTRIDGRLRGIRPRGVPETKEVLVYALPNGDVFTGTDEIEYQQEYAAALVEMGVEAEMALTIAKNQKLTLAK